MATNKNPLKGLHKVKAKGKTYCYAWRGGPKIVAEPGTREFLEEFVAARSPHIDGSRFAGWVQKYQASEDYKGISDKTKSNWGPILDEIRDHFGALPVRLWSNPKIRHDIRVWRDKWRGTPRASDVRKTVLSRVCSFMVANGELMVNPCIGIENLYTSDRSEIIWTEADLAALLAAASQEIGWVAQLAALTGMRQGDLLKLRWGNINDLAIEIKTGKSGFSRDAIVPITAPLRALLASIPKRALTVLTNTRCQPWRTGFGASWQDALDLAGLKGRNLHFHDFKGTAVTNFYRAGFTSQEIADIVGWEREAVESIINKYLKRDELLLDRIRRLELFQADQEQLANKSVKLPVKPG